MTRIWHAMAAVAIALVSASSAEAQPQTISLTPSDAPRWDVSGQVAWLGRHQPAVSQWNGGWFDAASVAASAGYFWTTHLKLEGEVATSSPARFYTVEPAPLPARSAPFYRTREHALTQTTAAGGVAYQFFENRWIHPFITAGLEVARERDRIETYPEFTVGPDGRPTIPTPSLETNTSYAVRPTFGGGFKFYVGERAFVRTELRSTVDADGAATLAWRGGIGVDF